MIQIGHGIYQEVEEVYVKPCIVQETYVMKISNPDSHRHYLRSGMPLCYRSQDVMQIEHKVVWKE